MESGLNEEKLITLMHVMNNFDEINNFFMNNYWNKNRDLREVHMKSLHEMEELKRFQGSIFDEFSRRRLIKNRDIILELTAKIQELQNEVNCLNDSKMLNQYAVDNPTLHVNLSLNEMEELKKFQSSTFDTIARRRLGEDQDTILELTGKIQEFQNEIN